MGACAPDSVPKSTACTATVANEAIGTYQNLGGVTGSSIGPGPNPGTQRYYVSYLYGDGFELVAIDPTSGASTSFRTPIAAAVGAELALGDDGRIYLGTRASAHFMVFDPAASTLSDLGVPSSTETYIWGLTVAPNHVIYAGTSPGGKLVSYNPATGVLADLGRMDPTQEYARTVAAGSDGYVYVGMGANLGIVAYNTTTATASKILPSSASGVGFALVWKGSDGNVYAKAGSQCYQALGGALTALACSATNRAATNVLPNGSTAAILGNQLVVTSSTGVKTTYPYSYSGEPLAFYAMGVGPDGMVYGSTAIPFYLVRIAPCMGTFTTVGQLGTGEAYSLLAHTGRLLIAAYAGYSPLFSYNPITSFSPGTTADSNPLEVSFASSDASWRPGAMVGGADGTQVFIGSQNGYGVPGGALTVWVPSTNTITTYNEPIAGQSVLALAEADGEIIGGTSIYGGSGTTPTTSQAELFVWDPLAAKVVFSMVPVPGATSVLALVRGTDGDVYGVAGDYFFVFDPVSRSLVAGPTALPLSNPFVRGLYLARDGSIWGVAEKGIYTIDEKTRTAQAVLTFATSAIYEASASDGQYLYYGLGTTVYRYALP